MRQKPTLLEILVIIAIIGVSVALFLPSSPGPPDATPRYPSSVVAGVKLAQGFGDYYLGYDPGRYWHLSILRDGRYSYVWPGRCPIYLREPGQAREVEGRLVLTPEKPDAGKILREFLPIRWDERSYLIRPGQLPEFCEAIVTGTEPRNELRGTYFLSNLGRAEGLPNVPEEWLAYLRARLTIGKIIEVSDGSRAKVALGSEHGLKVGDLLRLQGESPPAELRVTAVEDDSCLVMAVYPGKNDDVLKPGRNVIIARPEISAPDQ